MADSIKVTGTWRTVSATYVRIASTWRSVIWKWIKVSGTWAWVRGDAPKYVVSHYIPSAGSTILCGWPFTSGSGYGTKITDSSTSTGGGGAGTTAVTLDNKALFASASANGISAWAWSGSSFGSMYSAATGGAVSSYGVFSSPDSKYVGMFNISTSPYTKVWNWNSSTGFGSGISAGTWDGTSSQRRFGQFNSRGTVIHSNYYTSPWIYSTAWTGTGHGTKYADPSTLPAGYGYSVAFNAEDEDIGIIYEAFS